MMFFGKYGFLKLHIDQTVLCGAHVPNFHGPGEKMEGICDKSEDFNSQKFDDSLDLNDALYMCVVDLNLVQQANFKV